MSKNSTLGSSMSHGVVATSIFQSRMYECHVRWISRRWVRGGGGGGGGGEATRIRPDLPVLSSYVCDHAASPRISVNADTMLKCLASGQKSVE